VFLRSPYRRFPVLEDNRVVGIVSRRDVLSAALDLLGKVG
jgi:CBS domain-containing protein